MNWRQVLLTPVMASAGALLLAGCGTSVPLDAKKTVRQIVGTDLPSAQGKTQQDQDKIDSAVAGLCGAGIYDETDLCDAHTIASAERRRELIQ